MKNNKNKKTNNPTEGYTDISRLGEKPKKKNDVRSITTKLAISKMISNTQETALFGGRLVNDAKLWENHILVSCHDCAYAIEITPAQLFDILSTYNHVILDTYTSKQIGWPNIGTIADSMVREASMPKE